MRAGEDPTLGVQKRMRYIRRTHPPPWATNEICQTSQGRPIHKPAPRRIMCEAEKQAKRGAMFN